MAYKTEESDGMIIEWDVPLEMDDGVILRADIFRPIADGRYPVLMTYGPYAKGLHFGDGYPAQWEALTKGHPEIVKNTSAKYANWETADPERWVPHGYVCIRVDSRGAGQSPGHIDPFSPRETRDYYNSIEWAGVQPWSIGKVGLLGVAYYAMNQWQVAALRPPHLAAICPFEGASDLYRDGVRHGGILCTFWLRWYPRQVENVQYGLGEEGRKSRVTGEPIAGDETVDEITRRANRVDLESEHVSHSLFDSWFKDRVPDLSRIEVPLLSCGNWGGQGLHLRGNIEGFLRAGSSQKWLEMHGLEHWTEFYTDYGVALQKRFMDHFLKGIDNGWDKQAPLQLKLRTPSGFSLRHEREWPLARTQWKRLYLDGATNKLAHEPPVSDNKVAFDALASGITFNADPYSEDLEITGPLSARICASSTTTDFDIFLTLRLFDPTGQEILFVGAVEPNAPVTQGWLRASHRRTNPDLSLPWRPWRDHAELEPVVPGEIYELDVEIWPTSIKIPAGYRLVLTISGQDFDHGLPEPMPKLYGYSQRGSSVYVHDNDQDRPKSVYGGVTTIYTGCDRQSSLLLPVIPT